MKKLLAALLCLLGATVAYGQTAPPTPDPVSVYVASVPLTVTTSSARVPLPSTIQSIIALTISNDGTSDLCFALGSVSVVATNDCLIGASTSTSLLVRAGRSLTVWKKSTDVDIAAIGSGATILTAYQANGPLLLQGVTGGSGNNSGGGYLSSGKTPVTGTFGSTGQSASFTPLSGRGFNLSLWGTFVATIQLERSFDGGTTWFPLTAAGTPIYKWTASASESAEEEENSVLYRLNCNAYISGTVNYRISQ